MAKLYYVGFNGYGQCPKNNTSFPKVIADWICTPITDIYNMCCTHRNVIIETKHDIELYGMTGLNTNKSFKKIFDIDSIESCDEFLITTESNNLWKYYYENSQWIKLNLNFSNEKEGKIWREIENKIEKLTFHGGTKDIILLLKSGNVWLFSEKNELRLLFSYEVDKAIDIASGLEHTLILTECGCVLSFGNGSRGQLGNESLNSESQPIQIPMLEGLKISKIGAGGWHSCAITDSGDLYMWGWNNYGQLSAFENGQEIGLTASPVIVDVVQEEDKRVIDVACGTRHTMVKLCNGDLYATGWNAYRQLGVQSVSEKISKFTKSNLIGNQNRKLLCGPWYTVLLETS